MIDLDINSLDLPCILGGRYECRKRIGSGGMGEVYQARHLGLERDVAVKVLTPTGNSPKQMERVKERFRREAVALSRLRHPNTVQVIDFGWTDDQRPYIVTELLTGKTLDKVLHTHVRLPPERALNIVIQVCRSLAEAHSYGIVHRDLKPSNIFLLEAFGTRDYVKLIDFGVARIDQTDESARARPLTVEGTTLGTPDYMAPEQARGHTPSPATDVYALGCMIYEMCTGEPPFTGDSALQVMIKHIKAEPALLSEAAPDVALPAGLEHAVALCMRKDMAQRPADSGVFLGLIEDIQRGPKKPSMEEVSSINELDEYLLDSDEVSFSDASFLPKNTTNPGRHFFAEAAGEVDQPQAETSGIHRVHAVNAPHSGQDGYQKPLHLKRGRKDRLENGEDADIPETIGAPTEELMAAWDDDDESPLRANTDVVPDTAHTEEFITAITGDDAPGVSEGIPLETIRDAPPVEKPSALYAPTEPFFEPLDHMESGKLDTEPVKRPRFTSDMVPVVDTPITSDAALEPPKPPPIPLAATQPTSRKRESPQEMETVLAMEPVSAGDGPTTRAQVDAVLDGEIAVPETRNWLVPAIAGGAALAGGIWLLFRFVL